MGKKLMVEPIKPRVRDGADIFGQGPFLLKFFQFFQDDFQFFQDFSNFFKIFPIFLFKWCISDLEGTFILLF